MISDEVQVAIYQALVAGVPVCGGRVHDDVPEHPEFPYVSIGDENMIDDSNGCDAGWEVFSTVHVWSRAVGRVEAKTILADVAERLGGISALSGHSLIDTSIETSRIFRDPDGLTTHGVVSVKFIVTPSYP